MYRVAHICYIKGIRQFKTDSKEINPNIVLSMLLFKKDKNKIAKK